MDIGCSNCASEPEHTFHLFYECRLAMQIWVIIFRIINDEAKERDEAFAYVDVSSDTVLFHHLPNVKAGLARDNFIEIIMIVKHVLYKLKFRPDVHRLPTLKRALLLIILDIENVIKCKKFKGIESNFMCEVYDDIKRKIGM